MAKRQVRIKYQHLNDKLPEFLGKKIHVIMKNGSVIFMNLTEINGDSLNGRNMRLDKMTISMQEIEEVIIDINS
ncbi:hypothetical protein [Fulvivirga sedimenti]|jgi:hypothetical protein|uniref:Uncharacterized protein n=1 Tax=Fulvivirga sedimenti TaxID=2879465 RepID=A0A9X1HNL7_9BACT|nr:hypothetical protein [Fulvivirga sedimenti]MCA6073917.1 hypothetical protein [Fulvivirga sedimenti]